jgi:ABC-type transport system involved in multi-copper enzyme maturation permease subunit
MPDARSPFPILSDSRSRRLQRWNDALNPILVKELRQLWKSRQFVVIFFVLLTAAWVVSTTALLAPDVLLRFAPFGYGHTGQIHAAALFFTLYCCLVIALNFAVPLRALDSLAHEFAGDTMEMMVLTRIPSDRITIGKFWCAVLHMGLYFAALGPFIAVTYLLPGIDLPTIALLLVVAIALSSGLSCMALWLGSYCKSAAARPVLTMVLLATCCLTTWVWLTMVYGTLQFGGTGSLVCSGLPCCFVPWLVISSASLAAAVVRVRPKSPRIDRIEFVSAKQLQRIAEAVLKFSEAVRVQFPVAYNEPPARPPRPMLFREAQQHVLNLARIADRMLNRNRRPIKVVVAQGPLVPHQLHEQFARMRLRLYAVISLYHWSGICHDDPYVHRWSDRRQMPNIPATQLNELDAAARDLIEACGAVGEVADG